MKKLLLLSAFLFVSSSWSMAQSAGTPPGGMSEIQAYSIFLENYKNESYETAIKFGRWMWEGMPETIEGYSRFDLKKNLDRLITSYSGLADKLQDPSLKEAYIDTALTIYDKLFEKYPDKEDHLEWYIGRGRLLQSHADFVADGMKKAAGNYLEAFKLNPEKFTKDGEGYYMQVMVQELVSEGKKDQSLAIIKQADPYASAKLQSYFDKVRNQLFDSPEERITFLEGQLKDNPNDEKVLKQLGDLYQDQEMIDKARKVSQMLYKLNPSYENVMALADFAISNANYDMAIKYLKEASQKADQAKQKGDIALKISNAYLNKEELQSARKYANQAANYRPDWGEPYIKIADIYAQTVSQCTNNRKMTRQDKVVYWLVLDYLDKAKRVDPNVANEVSRKYQAYEPVTPTTEEKFFWQPPLKTGDKFKIDSSLMKCYGWINETTTVR
ncbi:MAG: hypothetical protein PVI44_11900 [Balneolaceae bacterium]|jgi:tetratricopeptide (TPR) repeat protein